MNFEKILARIRPPVFRDTYGFPESSQFSSNAVPGPNLPVSSTSVISAFMSCLSYLSFQSFLSLLAFLSFL